jgi:predicted nucleotidyltransferase
MPEAVERTLMAFVGSARSVLGSDLKSVVLYGSAAEGRLRKTSDVNIIVVLEAFDPDKLDQLREPLRTAHAAIELEAMFLLHDEIPAAIEAFAVKFADIRHRRRILHGSDPFTGVAPSRGAEIARLKQVLLNLVLRLRQRYLLRSLRDEQAAALVADTAAPLRACAEALRELQGKPTVSPKEALAQVAAALPGNSWEAVLENVSRARETGTLPPGEAPRTLLRLLDLAGQMQRQVDTLR